MSLATAREASPECNPPEAWRTTTVNTGPQLNANEQWG